MQHVLPDLSIPSRVRTLMPLSLDGGASAEWDAEWDPEARTYRLVSVTFQRPAQAGGLSAAEIRAIPIAELFQRALQGMVKVNGEPATTAVANTRPADYDSLTSSEQLVLCARRYALDRALGRSPLKSLAEWLGVSQSTATRIAARARAAGVLD